MLNNFVALDLETTGTDPERDEIIEIGLVRMVDGQEQERLTTLVRPGEPLPLRIKRLTGLTDRDLAAAPAFEQVQADVLAFIGDSPMVGHNVAFDHSFLSVAVGKTLANPLYDSLELARLVLPAAASHRLGELCRLLQIDQPAEHRALDDARAAAVLVLRLSARVGDMESGTIWQLAGLLAGAGSPWADVFSRLARQVGQQFPDRKLKARIGGSGAGYGGRSKDGDRPARQPVPMQDIDRIMGAEGAVAAKLDNYEYRSQQLEMAHSVIEAFNENKILLVEAGTGTGKSLAYLVPAILWARQNGERVLVATRTINLQEQLWDKDIPFLQSLADFSFQAALLKGRQNYLCLRRWQMALVAAESTPEEALFLARLFLWTYQTTTGDRSELNLPYTEMEYWYQVCSDTEACLGSRCRHFNQACFFAGAKRRAEQADIIIVNHSLLLADIRAENRILPAYRHLIIDEAHHLEEVATEHLGRQVSRRTLLGWLTIAGKLLVRCDQPASGSGDQLQKLLPEAREARQNARKTGELFFAEMGGWLSQVVPGRGSGLIMYRYGPGSQPLTPELATELANLLFWLRSLTAAMVKLAGLFDDGLSEDEKLLHLSRELASQAAQGEKMTDDLEFTGSCADQQYVLWAEAATRGDELVLRAAPVYVGALLQELLFSPLEAVVLTSATMTVDNSFAPFADRVGLTQLPAEGVLTRQLSSPFYYQEQALLGVVQDLPVPGQAAEDDYIAGLARAIGKLVLAARGRTMVLFTSHRTLRDTYSRIKLSLEEMDICLLGHDIDGNRSRLVEDFRKNPRSVLFGAASFWEGVDIPGAALSCVIIVKLPFAPPNHPVIEARLEQLNRQGKNSFRELTVPKAIIKFKQGFGRLIRTGFDQGAVIVLDSRLVEKRYGSYFLHSLPVKNHIRGNIDDIARRVESWLNYQK